MSDLTVVIPFANEGEEMRKTIASIRDTSRDSDVEIVCIVYLTDEITQVRCSVLAASCYTGETYVDARNCFRTVTSTQLPTRSEPNSVTSSIKR